jgi:hypothetical protein
VRFAAGSTGCRGGRAPPTRDDAGTGQGAAGLSFRGAAGLSFRGAARGAQVSRRSPAQGAGTGKGSAGSGCRDGASRRLGMQVHGRTPPALVVGARQGTCGCDGGEG